MRKTAWIAVLAAALATGCRREPPLPVFGEVPSFVLTSQTGEPFDRASLDGKVWVADFFFTSCMGPCPMMSSKMRRIQDAVAAYPDVRLVSFSVDPENDTPAVLAGYAKRYRAAPGRWFFLTGDRATLDRLGLDTFKLQSVDGSRNHSTRFELVDRRGRIRGTYISGEEDATARLLADLQRLRKES